MMAAVSSTETDVSSGIPQNVFQFYLCKNHHDIKHTTQDLNMVQKSLSARQRPNRSQSQVHTAATTTVISRPPLDPGFFQPPPMSRQPPNVTASCPTTSQPPSHHPPHPTYGKSSSADTGAAHYHRHHHIQEHHYNTHYNTSNDITSNDAVRALQDCCFRVNGYWEALLIRLGLLADQLVPLRQMAQCNSAAGGYNALTQGMEQVSSAVRPITWRTLIDAVRGIGETVTADKLEKRVK